MDETFSKIEKALKDREERLVEGINSWATAWTVTTDNQRKDNLYGQTSSELQKEMAAVKKMVNYIVV